MPGLIDRLRVDGDCGSGTRRLCRGELVEYHLFAVFLVEADHADRIFGVGLQAGNTHRLGLGVLLRVIGRIADDRTAHDGLAFDPVPVVIGRGSRHHAIAFDTLLGRDGHVGSKRSDVLDLYSDAVGRFVGLDGAEKEGFGREDLIRIIRVGHTVYNQVFGARINTDRIVALIDESIFKTEGLLCVGAESECSHVHGRIDPQVGYEPVIIRLSATDMTVFPLALRLDMVRETVQGDRIERDGLGIVEMRVHRSGRHLTVNKGIDGAGSGVKRVGVIPRNTLIVDGHRRPVEHAGFRSAGKKRLGARRSLLIGGKNDIGIIDGLVGGQFKGNLRPLHTDDFNRQCRPFRGGG